MDIRQQNYFLSIIIGLLFCCKAFAATEFEPGVGLGLEYTDNVNLSPDDKVNDLITVGYVGARISENAGPLKYDVLAALNKQNYTENTFENQSYYNLGANAEWEMMKDRFSWFLSDRFKQTPVISINSNTPDNLQDSNVFTLGANIRFLISGRQSLSLVPTFNQYYFEKLLTDNKQYSLVANWSYQMFRLVNVGLSLSERSINYTETNFLGQSIEDVTFTTLSFTFNGQRLRSSFSGSLGSTKVERDNRDATSGLTGFLSWLIELSSRSTFDMRLSTDMTDTSSLALGVADGGGDVQITTDVVRNSAVNLAYIRDGSSIKTNISARYHSLTYSENPLDRTVYFFGVNLGYPVTQLLSSGVYANYSRSEQLNTARLDKNYTVGSKLNYRFSRKLQGLFDLKYRTKESTTFSQNYDEVSVFASLVYGFGNVQRPTRTGY